MIKKKDNLNINYNLDLIISVGYRVLNQFVEFNLEYGQINYD